MENQGLIDKGKQIIQDLVDVLNCLSDSEAGELLATGAMDSFLKAILDPARAKDYPNIGEFFLANKDRAQVLALLRHAITHNYTIRGRNDEGQEGGISPYYIQWFDDGVILLEGEEPFMGSVALYRNGKISYAISARDVDAGEKVGPDALEFVDIENIDQFLPKPPEEIVRLHEPKRKLEELLVLNNNDEARYQELLQTYPWVFGAQHKRIQRHDKFDDKNIPDFTGVRVHDNRRDIFEIKPPFLKLFQRDGEFHSNFLRAWDQAERYLDFARGEEDYLLRQKGLRFDNPTCYLICGYDLTEEQLKKIQRKQRMNSAIKLYTYNGLSTSMESTADFIRRLKDDAETSAITSHSQDQ